MSRLTERDVIDAALRLTRRTGVAGLSMRALADELGVTTMAAYHYVRNKEALLDLVANAVLGLVEIPPESSGDWAERIGDLNRAMHRVLLDYPGLGTYLLQRPLTEAGRRLDEATQQIMRDAGLSKRAAALAATLPQAFLFGRLSIETAVPVPGASDRATPRRSRPHLSADEVFEYGITRVVSALRAAAEDSGH
jgi:TetR/AcrR family tetracycline transcriptional repressor